MAISGSLLWSENFSLEHLLALYWTMPTSDVPEENAF